MNRKYLTLLGLLATSAILCALKARTIEKQHAPGGLQDQFQFKDGGGGSGVTENGYDYSFHLYSSPHGIKLLTYIEMFPSEEVAKEELAKKAKEASSIIARGLRLDRNGKPIGERVVLTVESKAKGETQSESFICWTTDSRLHWIQSESLEDALAFEKTLYP